MTQYFKVDIHAHILPKVIPDFQAQFGYGGFIQLEHTDSDYADMMLDTGKFFRKVDKNTWDPATRITEMDATGVDVQVLSTVPVMFSYWAQPEDTVKIAEFLNDDLIATINEYPDRFVGLATLPMNHPKAAVEELERAINLGFCGIEIGTHIGEKNLDDPSFRPLFAKAEELDAAVFVHPWDMPWREQPFWAGWLAGMPAETSKSIGDLIFGGVFEEFPNLRFAFSHCAGSFPGTIGRIEHGFNVRPDLFPVRTRNPRKYLGHFYADTLTADPDVLRYNLSVLGDESLMLGSDYPFPLGEHHPGKMIEEMQDLSDEQKEKILGLTALKWLGIPYDKFRSITRE